MFYLSTGRKTYISNICFCLPYITGPKVSNKAGRVYSVLGLTSAQIWPHVADWANGSGSWKLFSCHSFLASSTYMHLRLCRGNHYSLNCTLKKVISKIHYKSKNKASIAFFVHSLRASSFRQNYRPHTTFRNWRRWNSCILDWSWSFLPNSPIKGRIKR